MRQSNTVPAKAPTLLAAIVVLSAATFISGCTAVPTNLNVTTSQPATEPTPVASVNPTPEATPLASPTVTPTVAPAAVKTFTIIGKNFTFSETELRVKVGDRVKIIFKNDEGFHDWVIDEFNAKTPQLQAGNQAEVEFVVSKTGTFEYYCSVGNHRAMGMKGSLIVE